MIPLKKVTMLEYCKKQQVVVVDEWKEDGDDEVPVLPAVVRVRR